MPYGFSPANQQTIFLDLKDCALVLEHNCQDQVISVETGISLSDLNSLLAAKNQWLPLSFGSHPTNLHDLIATGDGGSLEHSYGGPRRLLTGLTVALSDGCLIRTGGRVVKNVTGYDLTKLMVGSYGIFGIPAIAHLRLYARPAHFATMVIADDAANHLFKYVQLIEQLGMPVVASELIDQRLLAQDSYKEIGNGSKYLLLVRLAGNKQVVDQSLSLLAKELSSATYNMQLTQGQEDESLWANLSDLKRKSRYRVEVATTRKTASIWLGSPDWLKDQFTLRTAMNKFMFYLPTIEAQKQLRLKLADYAKKSSQPLSLSYSDDQYIMKIEWLGTDMSTQHKLLNLLKKELDPSNALNPYVQFVRA